MRAGRANPVAWAAFLPLEARRIGRKLGLRGGFSRERGRCHGRRGVCRLSFGRQKNRFRLCRRRRRLSFGRQKRRFRLRLRWTRGEGAGIRTQALAANGFPGFGRDGADFRARWLDLVLVVARPSRGRARLRAARGFRPLHGFEPAHDPLKRPIGPQPVIEDRPPIRRQVDPRTPQRDRTPAVVQPQDVLELLRCLFDGLVQILLQEQPGLRLLGDHGRQLLEPGVVFVRVHPVGLGHDAADFMVHQVLDVGLAAVDRADQDRNPAQRDRVGGERVPGLLAHQVEQPDAAVVEEPGMDFEEIANHDEFSHDELATRLSRSKLGGHPRRLGPELFDQEPDFLLLLAVRHPLLDLADEFFPQGILDGITPLQLPAQIDQALDHEPLRFILRSKILHPRLLPPVILLLTFAW
jgi:hypothetical protein